eukprot:113145-Chlamydomonas_euryale.AAC.1
MPALPIAPRRRRTAERSGDVAAATQTTGAARARKDCRLRSVRRRVRRRHRPRRRASDVFCAPTPPALPPRRCA